MFSIIVPVHNVEAYVDYCIKSIISQSFSEFELILVVNASGDGSYKICKNWEEKDSRIHVIYTEVPGVSHARNLGLKESKGEWIIFVDADDYLLPDALYLFNEKIKSSNDDIDLIVANYTQENLTSHLSNREVIIEATGNCLYDTMFGFYSVSIGFVLGYLVQKKNIKEEIYNEKDRNINIS